MSEQKLRALDSLVRRFDKLGDNSAAQILSGFGRGIIDDIQTLTAELERVKGERDELKSEVSGIQSEIEARIETRDSLQAKLDIAAEALKEAKEEIGCEFCQNEICRDGINEALAKIRAQG